MAISKFGFKGVGWRIIGSNKFPGQQGDYQTVPIISPALFEEGTTYQHEFGEIVEIIGNAGTNLIIKPIDEDTAATAKLGVIMTSITGTPDVYDGLVLKNGYNVVVNLWVLNINQTGTIAVALQGATEPAIGGAVYLGNGEAGTIAGTVYASAVTGGTLAITNLEFASKQMTPSESTAKSVLIKVK